jgi:hypothetical protein
MAYDPRQMMAIGGMGLGMMAPQPFRRSGILIANDRSYARAN